MKKLIMLITLIGLFGCYERIAFGIEDNAKELCSTNNGLKTLSVVVNNKGTACKVICINGAMFHFYKEIENNEKNK